MFKIAVFASGGGSNFQSLIDRKHSGELPVEIAFLMVNNSTCGAVEKAQRAGIPVLHLSSKTHPDPLEYEKKLLDELADHRVDLIVLAGFMKKIPDGLLKKYAHKILNIHPSLLPAFGGEGFYGMNVHQAVYERGVKFSGMTIHLVSGDYDLGPILLQDVVEITSEDSPENIAAKVLKKEHEHYWKVVRAFATGEVAKEGERYWLLNP